MPDTPIPDTPTGHACRLVLFDMDDTLYDFTAAIRAGLDAIGGGRWPLLTCPSPEALYADYMRILYELHPLAIQGVFTIEESRRERLRRLFAELGEEISPATLAEVESAFNEAYHSVFLPVAGARALLAQLAGRVGIGVLSNNVLSGLESMLRRLGLDEFFQVRVAADMVGVTKPDPAMFRYALDKFGAKAAETVMVGDSWKNDVLGAAAVGIRPVWFNRFGRPCPDPAVADQLTALEPAGQAMELILKGSRQAHPSP